ncbi:MAG: protein kinase [Verrucomicrobia bacterium]|nr:protein kinase [Verrucomicrobiota bacterium]
MPDSEANDGTIRHGHYTVRKRPDGGPVILGAGAMGITYRAWDERLRIDVALKVITPSRLLDREAQSLFLREARAAARVRHPNVASVLFLGDTPGAFFYAMEFIEGQPLDSWLRERAPLTVRQSLSLASKIAAGLGAIHDAQLVHRDLKPANIMVVPRGGASPTGTSTGYLLKIIDFGLARNMEVQPDESVQTVGFRGTLRYASPEQCEERRDLDGRTDLYALGCILWEMLSGDPPFQAATQRGLLNQHVTEPPPLHRLEHCPPSVRKLVASLLEKDRTRRPANAHVVEELITEARRKIESGGEPDARAPLRPVADPTVESTIAWVPERRAPRWLVPAAGAALLVLGLGAGWWLRQPAGPAPGKPAVVEFTPASKKTVAVLPFEVLSGEKEDMGLADGIHEDLIVNLVKLRDLKVISRTSVQIYRGPTRDLRQIAQQLRVGSIVEGTVRRSGNRVRVSAGLVEVSNGSSIWAENFEGDAADLFQLQTALAKRIAASLETRLTPAEDRALELRPTQNAKAWAAYQRAREIRRRSLSPSRESAQAVVDAFEQAVAEDPKFALGQAQLALAHGEMYWFRIDATPARREAMEKAVRAARALEPDLPESHLAYGSLLYRIDRDYPSAYQEFKAAEVERPNDPQVLFSVAIAARRLGLWEESERAFRAAAERAPTESQIVNELAETLSFRRKHLAAAEWLQRLSEFYPQDADVKESLARFQFYADSDWVKYRKVYVPLATSLSDAEQQRVWFHLMDRDPHTLLAWLLPRLDRPIRGSQFHIPASFYAGFAQHLLGQRTAAQELLERAVRELQEAIAAHPPAAYERSMLAQALALLGRKTEASEAAETAMRDRPLTADALSGGDVALRAAVAFAWLGERDRAFQLLSTVLAKPADIRAAEMKFHPAWDALRRDARFTKLVAELETPIVARR